MQLLGFNPAVGQKRPWDTMQQTVTTAPAPSGDGGSVSSKPLTVKYKGVDGSPSDSLYVTGLPNAVDQATLTQLFDGIGCRAMWSKLVPDALGTGFCAAMVQVGSQEEAASAIDTLNGQIVQFAGLPQPQKGLPVKGVKGGGKWGADKGWGKGGDSGDWWQSAWEAFVKAKGGKGDAWGGKSAWDSWDSWDSWGGGPSGWDAWSGSAGGAPASGPVSKTLKLVYAGRDHVPSDNLYITGLPAGVDKSLLDSMFTDLGYRVLQSRVITDHTNSGTCVGMVRLGSEDEAAGAIAMLNNQPISFEGGSNASPSAKGGKGSGPQTLRLKYAGKDDQPSESLYLTGLPASMDEFLLAQVFTSIGITPVKTKIIPDQWGTGYCAGMATLSSQVEAAAAIETLNGQVIELAGGAGPAASPNALPAKGKGSWPAVDSWGDDFGGKGLIGAGGKGFGFEGDCGKGLAKGLKGDAFKGGKPKLKDDPNFVKPLMVKYAGREGFPSESVYITGVPSVVDDTAITQIFTAIGLTVTKARIIPDQWSCGYSAAMVSLASTAEATMAIDQLTGHVVQIE